MRLCSAVALVVLCLAPEALAQSLAGQPDPEGAGFSPKRLARIAPWYQKQVDEGALPGAVVAIARDGKLAYLQAVGTQDWAKKSPMKPDSIFWIASMTKPVTSVAAMMLFDEGKLDLDAPVSKYLPELADMKVGIERVDPETQEHSVSVVPAKRAMQVIDLLRHTSGLTYPEEGNDRLHQIYGLTDFARNRTLADFTKSLGWLPLLHQPGEVWEYSWGVDVLARVVEVASGQSFDQFLQQRIFAPLNMVDTGFFVPPEKLDRLVDPIAGGRRAIWDVTKPATLFSGGGGLVSTAPDYRRFCQMLLNGGELDSVRLLKPETVKRMVTPALPAGVTFAGANGQWIGPKWGSSWGLGFNIRTNADSSLVPGRVGSFKWSGLWGTDFWIDPVEKLIVLEMIQVPPDKDHGRYRSALRLLTYGAFATPKQAISGRAVSVDAAILARYAGTYDFGASISARDRQETPPFSGLGLPFSIVDGQAVAGAPIEGAPAMRAGVKQGDVITEIDGLSTKGLHLQAAIDRMRGPAGSEVHLTVKRPGEEQPRAIAIVRQMIRPPGVRLRLTVEGNALVGQAVGPWDVLDFETEKPVPLRAVSTGEFVAGETRLSFLNATGKTTGLVLNPGEWQIEARKLD